MITELTLQRDEKTQKILNSASGYKPGKAVRDRTAQVIQEFTKANGLRYKSYTEFNVMSLVDRINLDLASWNQLTGESSDDPGEAWRSTAFRPIVRNKVISIVAQLTASIIYPQVYAQNKDDEEDRDAAMVMRDIMEWVQEKYDYDKTFIDSVLNALISPACFIHQQYTEKYRKIKEVKPNGKWEIKEILDELYSGFRAGVVPCEEMWVADFYTHELQKQPYLFWSRIVPYSIGKAMYGDRPEFQFVRPGVQNILSDDRTFFYESSDEDLQQDSVQIFTYYNREADLQLEYCNGVLLSDIDQPNPRQDKRYPFVKTGYELIDTRFFYYKSLCFKTQPDEDVVNTLYRMIIDGTYLQIMPPSVVFSDEMLDSQIMVPGGITTISDPNPQSSFQTISTNNNLTAGFNTLEKVEASISESSTDNIMGGQQPGGDPTAFEVSRLEQNSKIMLGLFAKMIGFMVKGLGDLIISDILQFATVGQVMKTQSPSTRMKFMKFILPDKTIDGKTKSKRIEFDMELPDEMTKEQQFDLSAGVAKEEQEMDDKTQIFKVNPTLFRELQFRTVVRPEAISPKSDILEKALNLEEYALGMQNELVNKEAITRDLLLGSFDKTKTDPDKYMVQPEMMGAVPGMPGEAPQGMGGMKQALGSEIPSNMPKAPKPRIPTR
jgi:hypothetical protein